VRSRCATNTSPAATTATTNKTNKTLATLEGCFTTSFSTVVVAAGLATGGGVTTSGIFTLGSETSGFDTSGSEAGADSTPGAPIRVLAGSTEPAAGAGASAYVAV